MSALERKGVLCRGADGSAAVAAAASADEDTAAGFFVRASLFSWTFVSIFSLLLIVLFCFVLFCPV